LGYNGQGINKNQCAMAISVNVKYDFTCNLRNVDFVGEVIVAVKNEQEESLTEAKLLSSTRDWSQSRVELAGLKVGYGKLVITCKGQGQIDIDCVSFMNQDSWGHNDPKWQHGKFRKDLVQALVDLKPKFMRFPGGCIIEGRQAGNEYDWKDTVGNLFERKSKFNLWAERVEGGGYNQSYQIGFYEYFCLCEDLAAKPLPTLFAGLNCQVRTKDKIDKTDSRFRDYVVQNYLNLIEFAKGDPEKSRWAALRRDMGHPEPFNLEMIGVGNENFGKDYHRIFWVIKLAINSVYPEIKCIMSAGLTPFRILIASTWRLARKHFPEVLVDEHSYHSPEWFTKAARRFDRYKRGTAKVYFGEYAANGMLAGKKISTDNSNEFVSALAAAAFLTGVERNSDVVEMTSYAPLLNLAGGSQWHHNLIDFNPSGICYTMNYFVQKMFATHLGEFYIPMAGKLPRNLFLSATADKHQTFVKIVNTSDQGYAINIKFSDVINQPAEILILTHKNLKARNSLGFWGEPQYATHVVNQCCAVVEGVLGVDAPPYSVQVISTRL